MAQIRPSLALILVVLCVTLFGAQPAAARTSWPELWGSNEIYSPNLVSFTNWTGVMRRFDHARELGEGLCASAGYDPGASCAWDDWQELLSDVRSLRGLTQLREVNDLLNKRRYILDMANWGDDDYWATVFEFLRRNGDCEDYALAKYVTLRELGWPADKLRLAIVRDTKLNLNHAILLANVDGEVYIGDNQVEGLVRAESIRHYRPIYSINETGWWLHRGQRR